MLSDKGTVVADQAKEAGGVRASGAAGRGAEVLSQVPGVCRGRKETRAWRARPRGFRLSLVRSVLAAALASLLPLYGAAAQEATAEEEEAEKEPQEYSLPEEVPASVPVESAPPQPESEAVELEKVTVTGTRIRGGTTPSPVITIGSENIREEGFTDLGEVIRSVPQNFSGGQNPGVARGATAGIGGIANQNITGGSSLNLRGLGPDASLTLLNGRRLAYGGLAQTVDISGIPVEAVERIEIVADGASAIYGSDAVGGVANVILRQDFDGVAVGTRYGTATDGGLTTHEYGATAGTTWSTGGLIATYKSVSVDPIYASERDYTADHMPIRSTIYPGSDLRSGLFSTHQSLGDVVALRLDALRTERDQAFNFNASTFYHAVRSKSEMYLVAPSIELSFANGWTLSIGGSHGKDESVLNNSRINIATGVSTLFSNNCYCNELFSYEVGAEGPLFALAGGDARLAVGVGRRKNDFTSLNYLNDTFTTQGSEGSRFAYAEINLPLISPDTSVAGVQRLLLTAAVRGEDYDSFGRVSIPKFGLIYGPSPDVTLKASWGKSFKAPTLLQQHQVQSAALFPAAMLGGTDYAPEATALLFSGGNPSLGAERARTWAATLALHPEVISGLEAELTWFDIDYTDRVIQPITDFARALTNPNYARFTDFSPTDQALEDIFAAADVFNSAAPEPYDPIHVVAILHGLHTNVAAQRIRGLDLSASYQLDLGISRLLIRGSSSWLDSSQKVTPTEDAYDLAGTLFNPVKINGRLGAVWSRGDFMASAFANYKSGAINTVDGEKGSSFTTLDVTLRYGSPQNGGARSSWSFVLSAQNMLDRSPPLFMTSDTSWAPYDSTNYSAVGRFLSLSVAKSF